MKLCSFLTCNSSMFKSIPIQVARSPGLWAHSSLLQHNSAYCRALLSTGAGPKAPTIWLRSGAVVHLAWTTFMGTSGLQQPMHFLSTVSRSNSTYSSFFELDMSILTPPCSPFFQHCILARQCNLFGAHFGVFCHVLSGFGFFSEFQMLCQLLRF